MAFNAGAAIARLVMDTTSWDAGSKKIQASQGKLAGVAKGIGVAFAAAGAAIVAGLVASAKKADEFNKEFANVSTLVDTSAINMEKMQAQLLGLDSRLGSATDLTKGLYQAISASVDPAKAVEFIGEAAKFAKAALVDTNTAVDVITTGLNAYGLEAEKSTEISDQLFSVIKLGKTNGAELSSVIGQVIPMAANLGVGFDELGASIAISTRQGVSAAESTTQLNGVMTSLLKPSDDLKAALTKLGYESGEAAIKALGFKGTIEALNDSTGGSKEQLAGMFNNVRALKGVLALTGKGASDFSSVLDEIKNSAGATDEAFGKQQLTFETLQNSMDKAAITIGNTVLPMVYSAVESMNSFFEENKAQITGILSNLPEVTMKAFQLVGDIMKKAVSWDGIKATVANLGAGFVKVFRIAIEKIPGLFKAALDFLLAPVKNFGDWLGSVFKNIFAKIANFFIDALNKIPFVEIERAAVPEMKKFGEAWENTLADMGTAFDSFTGQAKDYLVDVAIIGKDTGLSVAAQFKPELDAFLKYIKGLGTAAAAEMAAAVETAAEETGILLEEQAEAAADLIDDLKKEEYKFSDEMINLEKRKWAAINAAREEANKAEIERQEELAQKYRETGESILSNLRPIFASMGEMFVDQEAGWESFKRAAKNAIADVLEAFAAQWAVLAVAAWAAVALGDLLAIPAATGYTAASAAGYITAGTIRAMKDGGYATGLTLVGEEGPEMFDFSGSPGRVYSNTETNNILSNISRPTNVNIYNNVRDESDIQRVNQLFGRTLAVSSKAY